MSFPDGGFDEVLKRLTQNHPTTNKVRDTLFVGYRLKGFDEFLAMFKLSGNSHETSYNKRTCERIVSNTKPGSKVREEMEMALKYWPRA